MLIEIVLKAFGMSGTDTVVFLWHEKLGDRRCAMYFDPGLAKFIRAALRKLTHDDMLHAHSALLQFMASHMGTYVEQVTIPELRASNSYRMVVHFATPAGIIKEDFLPSDAVAMALYADCPVFIEERVLEIATRFAPTLAQLERTATDRDRFSEAEKEATTLPKDKLPQA